MRLVSVAAVSAVLLLTTAARATVITFDGLVPSTANASYTEGGFRVSASNGSIFVGDSFGAVTTGPFIFPSNVATLFTLETDDGRPFDLFSIDLGPINSSVGARQITFTGHLVGGGTTSTQFTTSSDYQLNTFNFGPAFTDLSSLTWFQGSAIADNINVVAVPEPATLATLLLGATALLQRRRVG